MSATDENNNESVDVTAVSTENSQQDEQPSSAQAENRVLPTPEKIDAIIRHRTYAAIALGFVPVPLVDLAGFTAIQVEMLHALCKEYDLPFKSQLVKSSLASLCSSGVGVATVPLFASLFKAIPVIGVTTGAATVSLTGAATTYALGRVFDRHFRNGGTLGSFDPQKSKAYFAEKLEEGKAYVKKMRHGKKTETEGEAGAEAKS